MRKDRRRHRSSRALATLLAASILPLAVTSSVPALAQAPRGPRAPAAPAAPSPPVPNAAAAQLKSDGDRFLAEKKFVEALDAYERSNAIEPNPALDYNRGRVLEFLGRYPEALDAIQRFQANASDELRAKVPGLKDLLVELQGKVATVVLKSNVTGARVLVGGKEVGQTPITKPLLFNAGKTTIELLADGYFPFRKEMTLPGNASTDVDATMASRDTFGYLVVKSTVPASLVYLDQRPIGVVPAEAALVPGTHSVRIGHEDYNDASTQVVLAAGERKELTLDPTKGTPLTHRWYFWTVAGVVVVGIATAVTVVALTTERKPPSGDFSPGQVSF